MTFNRPVSTAVIVPLCAAACIFIGGCRTTDEPASAVIEAQQVAPPTETVDVAKPEPDIVAAGVPSVETFVSSAEDIAQALKSAKPGDTLVMRNGDWADQKIIFTGQGAEDKPITLRAETPGTVILRGGSSLSISGSRLVVDGLCFEEAVAPAKERIIAFTGPMGHATDCQLTNTTMVNCNPEDPKTKYHWVELYGQRNRVDHCRFEGRNHRGVTVSVSLDDEPAGHRIDRNHFIGRTPPNANYREFETIRIGQNGSSGTRAGVTVDHNLFESEAGNADTILCKSGGNTIHHNGFIACTGGINLRQGDGTRVEGNVFLGRGVPGAEGILIAGAGHQVIGNYLQDVGGAEHGALTLAAGTNEPTSKTYQNASDTAIAFNTVVNPLGPALMLDWGFGRENADLRPSRLRVINNLFLGSAGGDLFSGTEGDGWEWANNLCYGTPLGIAEHEGITVIDPQLNASTDGLWRPAATSPVIDTADIVEEVTLSNDIDGQPRDQGTPDIGADEAETTRSTPRSAPLTGTRVGPKWLR